LYLTASKFEAPNPNCFVCKNATIPLPLNVNEWTLKQFLSTVVKEKLGFEDPTVMLQGGFIWEEGSVADSKEFMPNLPKTFAKLPCGGIQHGTILELDDASQNLTIQVSVSHKEHWDDANEEEFPFVVGALPSPKKVPPLEVAEAAAKPQQEQPAATTMTTTADNDDVVLVLGDEGTAILDDENAKKSAAKKRPAEQTSNGVKPADKKQKVDETLSKKEEQVIEID
jgi:hypothetical protein